MSSAAIYPLIEVSGTPYECGKQYGRAAAQLIRRNIEAYTQAFEFHVQLDRATAISEAEKYLPAIEQYDAGILAELEGIADGSGASFGEIVMLNARTELLSRAPAQVHECTSSVVVPPASSDGQVWLAQNWDWLHVNRGLTVLLKVSQVGKPTVVTLVEAGHVGKMGFNEAGLGLCVNWLEADKCAVGVPFIVLCRGILNSHQIIDAIDALYRCPRASAGNFLIAHRSGFAVDLETTSYDIDFLEPVNGLLVHTNHFVSPRLRVVDCGLRKRGGGSLVRRQLAQSILERHLTRIDLECLIGMQRDRSTGPYSICTTPAPNEPELARWATLAGVIMNLASGEMYIASGRPCDVEYVKVCG